MNLNEAYPETYRRPIEGRWISQRTKQFVEFIDQHLSVVFPAPLLVTLFLLIIFPLVYTGYLSFHTWGLSANRAPNFVWFTNYVRIFFSDPRFWHSLLITLYYSFLAVGTEIVLGTGIALILNRKFAGMKVVRSIFILPMAATPAAICLIWTMMFNPDIGVVNYFMKLFHLPAPVWLGHPRSALFAIVIVDIWMFTPFVVLVVLAGLHALPREPYEAAMVDGASPGQTLWYLTLPFLKPTIIVALIFRLVQALKTFDIIFIMTEGGPGNATETLNLYTFKRMFLYYKGGYSSALALVLLTIVLVVNIILIRLRRREWSY